MEGLFFSLDLKRLFLYNTVCSLMHFYQLRHNNSNVNLLQHQLASFQTVEIKHLWCEDQLKDSKSVFIAAHWQCNSFFLLWPQCLTLLSGCSQHLFLIKQLPFGSCGVAMETWALCLLSQTLPTEPKDQSATLCELS